MTPGRRFAFLWAAFEFFFKAIAYLAGGLLLLTAAAAVWFVQPSSPLYGQEMFLAVWRAVVGVLFFILARNVPGVLKAVATLVEIAWKTSVKT